MINLLDLINDLIKRDEQQKDIENLKTIRNFVDLLPIKIMMGNDRALSVGTASEIINYLDDKIKQLEMEENVAISTAKAFGAKEVKVHNKIIAL